MFESYYLKIDPEKSAAVQEELKKPIYGKKLEQALNLYWFAWDLKFASIKHFNPELSDEEITEKVKYIFRHATN